METFTAELVVDARATLGEGPVWSAREQALYWVDIEGRRVHRFDPRTKKNRSIAVADMPGAVVERACGGLVIADQRGFAALDFTSGRIERWVDPEADRVGNRFNDGKVDPAGRFWAGTMPSGDSGEIEGAALYVLDHQRVVSRVLAGITVANGLAWAADGRTFYYIDTATTQIAAFTYEPSRPAISERRVVVDIDTRVDGWPDGMCIDDEGMLWCAHAGGWAVHRWDPRTARKLATIPLPIPAVTSCCFGGERLDELYITTANRDFGFPGWHEHPHAGGLYRARVRVPGPAATLYAG